MFVALSERRCKYKKNLANNVHVSRIFCKNRHFFLISAASYQFFLHISSLFVSLTLILSAKIQKMDETAFIHFVHLYYLCPRN